ncbi:MAG: pentapeptide repeat-containing protein, partial [Saccharospirillaceae bacterium]|nr:pentapeptide repeat-containing protein [Saccharospirillaceae bacterium]
MTVLESNKFYGQTFRLTNYSQKKISGKEFDGCHFQSCDFSEATFLNCEFSECKFTDCNLSLLNVNNSKFLDVDFVDCKVIGVNWVKAYWRGLTLGSPLNFKRCMMNSSSFYGINLAKIVIEDCRAHDVDFREAVFEGEVMATLNDANNENAKIVVDYLKKEDVDNGILSTVTSGSKGS